MGKIEAVIFDWAGTTVDYGCFAPVQAFGEACGAAGIEPTMEGGRKPMGMLKRDHVKAMLSMPRISGLWKEAYGREFDENDVDEIYERTEDGILSIVGDFAAPKPYVTEAVKELRERGIKIGSTTGYTLDMMEIVAERARQQGYEPDEWFCPDATDHKGRPYPYMIFKNMQALGVMSVHNVMKVGDTVADIKEGKNAGVITVGVVEGSSVMGLTEEEFEKLETAEYEEICARTEKTYRDAGADYVIRNMKELTALIDRLEAGEKTQAV